MLLVPAAAATTILLRFIYKKKLSTKKKSYRMHVLWLYVFTYTYLQYNLYRNFKCFTWCSNSQLQRKIHSDRYFESICRDTEYKFGSILPEEVGWEILIRCSLSQFYAYECVVDVPANLIHLAPWILYYSVWDVNGLFYLPLTSEYRCTFGFFQYANANRAMCRHSYSALQCEH